MPAALEIGEEEPDAPTTATPMVSRADEAWPPSSPSMLLPQQYAAPVDVTAHECEPPADTDTAFARTTWVPPADTMTDTGVELEVVEAFPSCPLLFKPQHFTLPDWRTAHVWELPAETASAGSLAPSASTGVLVPLLAGPSSPLIPFPQQRTDPLVMTAHECSPPAVTETAPVNTGFGW